LLITYIDEAVSAGASLKPACQTAEITTRTYYRWKPGGEDGRTQTIHLMSANALTEVEKAAILAVCNSPEYAHLPPGQIVPRLADKGEYLASVSSFYRVLKTHNQDAERGRQQQRKPRTKPTTHIATGPNQVWSWDITYLPSCVAGRYYYLYLIMDIFSRKIVASEVHAAESGELATTLLQRAVLKEQCFKQPLVLHSDNGAPMKSFTFKAKMEELGIISSFSRPRVSDDNPYVESLFRTLKYCPQWVSKGFDTLEDARTWVHTFVQWYNLEHYHSGINWVTPDARHRGMDKSILDKRKEVWEAAKARHPTRWSGQVRKWEYQDSEALNPEREAVQNKAA
jgi:putative transposase